MKERPPGRRESVPAARNSEPIESRQSVPARSRAAGRANRSSAKIAWAPPRIARHPPPAGSLADIPAREEAHQDQSIRALAAGGSRKPRRKSIPARAGKASGPPAGAAPAQDPSQITSGKWLRENAACRRYYSHSGIGPCGSRRVKMREGGEETRLPIP